MPILLGLAQILLIGLVVYWLWLVGYTMFALTRPPRKTYAWALARNVPGDPGECDDAYSFSSFEVDGQRGAIECWRIAGNNPDAPCAVMTHGWGSSKQGGLKRLGSVIEHASEVILWDLPGHGESAGICTLGTGEHRDLLKIIKTIDPQTPVVLYGWSMGAGVCLKAASEAGVGARIAGVICESPYVHAITPARNVMRLRGFPTKLNLAPAMALLGIRFGIGAQWRGFARDQLVGDLPLLALHGSEDPVCPITDADTIVSKGRDATLVRIEDGGHNNLWTEEYYAEQMRAGIGEFFDTIRRG